MKSVSGIKMAFAALLLLGSAQGAWAGGMKAPQGMVAKKCMKCHTEYRGAKGIVAGDFYSRSNKAKSIQVSVNKGKRLIKYTAGTEVANVPSIKALKRPVPVRVHVKKVGADLVATKIVAKPKIKVPAEQLISTEALARIVSRGPEKGGYTLVDSRPGIRFAEAHIPTSISIPFPKMSEWKDRLPKDKDRLLIFYCGGFR